jgi:hypothetical protein
MHESSFIKVTSSQLSIDPLRYYAILVSTVHLECARLPAAATSPNNFVHLMVPIALIMNFQLDSRFESHDSYSLVVLVDSEIETVNINPN